MAKSGNPAKAAAENQEELLVMQVRAGIKAGKKATIPMTNKTKVTIDTTDVDEAEFLTRIIYGNYMLTHAEQWSMWVHAVEIYAHLYSTYPEYIKPLGLLLKRMQRNLEVAARAHG